MPHKVLLEDIQGPFIVSRDKDNKPLGLVTESRADGLVITRLPGRLGMCNEVNGNRRKYPKSVWENNLAEGSRLRTLMAEKAAFGLLEHPKDGVVDLNSPIAVITTEAKLNGDEVTGEIVIVNTAEGRKIHALIEAGYNPLVSSRGFGSLEKDSEGIDIVQDDYVCEGWDLVANPSFTSARLNPDRSLLSVEPETVAIAASNTSKPSAPSVAEAKTAPAAPAQIVETTSVKQPDSVAAPQIKKTASMKSNQIKESINTLRATDLSKLSPARFAESISTIEALHENVDATATAEGLSNWQTTKLHQDIEAVKAAYESAAAKPAADVKKLTEDKSKLLKVIKTVTETALTFKERLSETAATSEKKTKVTEELVRRGRGWKALAESKQERLVALQERYDISTEANDILAERYITDMTTMGRRLLTLEFNDKISNPEIAKLLKEAKHPRDLIVIREKLEGKPAETAPAAKDGESTEDKSKKTAPVATTESKKPATPAPAAPVVEPTNESVVDGDGEFTFGTSSLDESVQLTKRLSQARK